MEVSSNPDPRDLPQYVYNAWCLDRKADALAEKGEDLFLRWPPSLLAEKLYMSLLNRHCSHEDANETSLELTIGHLSNAIKTMIEEPISFRGLGEDTKAKAMRLDPTSLAQVLHDPRTPYEVFRYLINCPEANLSNDRIMIDVDEAILENERYIRKTNRTVEYPVTLQQFLTTVARTSTRSAPINTIILIQERTLRYSQATDAVQTPFKPILGRLQRAAKSFVEAPDSTHFEILEDAQKAFNRQMRDWRKNSQLVDPVNEEAVEKLCLHLIFQQTTNASTSLIMLRKMPRLRISFEFRNSQSLWDLSLHRVSQLEGAAAHLVGDVAEKGCRRCADGKGPFRDCIVVKQQNGAAYLNENCTNCAVTGHQCFFDESEL